MPHKTLARKATFLVFIEIDGVGEDVARYKVLVSLKTIRTLVELKSLKRINHELD